MKVRVDSDKCQGHARCGDAAPDIFQFDEWGHSRVVDENVPEGVEAAVRRAAAACPEHAITLEED